MVVAAKARAKRDSLPFSITVEDIRIPDVCPVLGLPIYRGKGQGGHCDNSPSLDQFVPGAGYTKENTRVICNRANVLKGNGTAAEHKAIASYIEQNS